MANFTRACTKEALTCFDGFFGIVGWTQRSEAEEGGGEGEGKRHGGKRRTRQSRDEKEKGESN